MACTIMQCISFVFIYTAQRKKQQYFGIFGTNSKLDNVQALIGAPHHGRGLDAFDMLGFFLLLNPNRGIIANCYIILLNIHTYTYH